jgi:hypothetical protein
MTATTFRKAGLAHRADIGNGEAFWLRRNDRHGFDLVWEFTDPAGRRRCVRLASHRNKSAAVADANALLSA